MRAARDAVCAVAAVAIANQVPRLHTPRCRLEELAPDPRRRWMLRHVEVHDAAALMSDEHDHVQCLQRERLQREEVGRPDVRGMILQERTPGLRRRTLPRLGAITPHGPRADGEAQRAQLPDDAHRAPSWVLPGQPANQLAQLGSDARSAGPTAATLPGPVATPGRPMPADDCLGLHELQMRAPGRPDASDGGPEAPIGVPQPGPR